MYYTYQAQPILLNEMSQYISSAKIISVNHRKISFLVDGVNEWAPSRENHLQ